MRETKLPLDSFEFYLSLGVERSYEKVAAHFGVSKRSVTKRARRDKWQAQIADLEEKAKTRAAEKALETLEEMRTRHLKTFRALQLKALEALRATPFETPADIVRALDIGAKNERLSLGEPTDRTTVSVEETIRNEYSRWLGEVPTDTKPTRKAIEDDAPPLLEPPQEDANDDGTTTE